MNREDIIRMAREAGAWSQQSKNCDVEYVMTGESLERFAALVAQRVLAGSYPEMISLVAAAAKAEEREACAKLADAADMYNRFISQEIAAAIRARGETK